MAIHPRRVKTLIVLLLTGMLWLQALLAWNAREQLRQGYSDFATLYGAGTIVREGLGRQLYDERTQFRVQRGFAPDVLIRQGAFPYMHAPFEAAVFVPFSLLSYFHAYLLWNLINLVVLCSVPWVLRPYLGILRGGPPLLWVLVAAAFFPIFIAFLQGQDIIFLLLFFTLTFISLKNGREFAAGAWLGLGLFRFHLVIPLLLVLVLRRRGKAVLGFSAVALALGLISVAVVGWKAMAGYPAYVWRVENVLGAVSADMPSLRGFLDSMIGISFAPGFNMVVVALTSIALVIFAASFWKPANSDRQFDLCFSLCVTISVMVGYHAFIYDLSLLLLPLLILANRFREIRQADGYTRLALLVPAGLLFLSPLQAMLVLRSGRVCLLVPVLLVWIWGMARLLAADNPSSAPLPIRA